MYDAATATLQYMTTGRKIHIRCDMEGVSGIVNLDQVNPLAPEYAEGRSWFMAELLALIDGLKAGASTEISVYDEHWFGRNIDLPRVPPGIRVISGKPPYRANWAGGLDASHAGMILHGLHSMAGTGRLLCHTYEPDLSAIKINNILVGEIGVETAIAGDYGVPLALVIADSAGADEAARLVPGVVTVVTKISQAETGAECLALVDNLEAIRAAALRVARDGVTTRPWRVESPIEMLFSFHDGLYLTRLREMHGREFVSDDTLKLVGPTVTSVWSEYWQRKLRVQEILRTSA